MNNVIGEMVIDLFNKYLINNSIEAYCLSRYGGLCMKLWDEEQFESDDYKIWRYVSNYLLYEEDKLDGKYSYLDEISILPFNNELKNYKEMNGKLDCFYDKIEDSIFSEKYNWGEGVTWIEDLNCQVKRMKTMEKSFYDLFMRFEFNHLIYRFWKNKVELILKKEIKI